jgi:hypothetical protein
MKPTPTERTALDLARTLTPLTLEDAAALARAPDLQSFARRHDRVRLAQTRLVWTAEAWQQRELRLSLYRYAVRDADRSEIHRQRVTALDTSTAHIRRALVTAHRNLLDADAAAFRLL